MAQKRQKQPKSSQKCKIFEKKFKFPPPQKKEKTELPDKNSLKNGQKKTKIAKKFPKMPNFRKKNQSYQIKIAHK